MKLLVIGIDGGDKQIINAMDMPFLQSLLAERVDLQVEEDLWGRGWAEILSGLPARETGAFYSKPRLNGTHDFTQSFGSADYFGTDKSPLWTQLTAKGNSVGFMNVPTTMPAPQVDGFFVAGAGGGSSASGASSVPEAAYHPASVIDIVNQTEYILDTRFMASGIKDAQTLMSRLSEMQERRTDAFIKLYRRHEVDFGFVAFRATTIIQYLAMSEIASLIANQGRAQVDLQMWILEVYRSLDKCIARLMQEVEPERLMIVSDHGAASRLATVNVNPFLVGTGFQKVASPAVELPKRALRALVNAIPTAVKQTLKSRGAEGMGRIVRPNVLWEETKAFGARYVSGIYINDSRRFGGPVRDEEKTDIAQQVIETFNACQEAEDYQLHARLYRQQYLASRCSDLLPDIWIDHPDTVFFEGSGLFVGPNSEYGPLSTSLHHVSRDQYTGIKGRFPLLYVDKKAASLVESTDGKDLTLAYTLIDRIMDS